MICFTGENFEDFFNIQLIEEYNQVLFNFAFDIPEIVTSIQFDIIASSKLRRYDFSNNYLPMKDSEFKYRDIEESNIDEVFDESNIEYFLNQNKVEKISGIHQTNLLTTDILDQEEPKKKYKECEVI